TSLGPRLRGDDVMMSPNALAFNAFIDSLLRGEDGLGYSSALLSVPYRCSPFWTTSFIVVTRPLARDETMAPLSKRRRHTGQRAKGAACDTMCRGNHVRLIASGKKK
ncbi:MAG: hypothetical protein JXX14_00720, partial [Deltaproteobacteria bacterium]|nr:hypothetical protein [Deltaproteobacteria bacterium]